MSNASNTSAAQKKGAAIEMLQEALASETEITAAFTIPSSTSTAGSSGTATRGRIAAVTPTDLTLLVPELPPAILQTSENDNRERWATVTIPAGSHEIVFFAIVRSVTASVNAEPGTVVVETPAELITTRRRRSFRSPAAATDGFQLHLWRISEHAMLVDRPRASQSFACDLHELSLDGFGATLYARNIEAMQLVAGQRFRVELVSADGEMLFEARLVHPQASARDDASVRCGFAIVAQERDIGYRRNRQKLEALLAQLQRKAAASASARKSA